MKEPLSHAAVSSNGTAAHAVPALEEYDLGETSRLLYDVYSLETFRETRYLTWQYRENPVGRAVEINRYDGQRLVAHMAGVPQTFHRRVGGQDEVIPAVILINIAISETARGRGLMTEIGWACFAGAHAQLGDSALIGVPNAASTPGYTGKLKFRLVGQLPVTVLPPVWPSLARIESRAVDDAYLESARFRELLDSVDSEPGSGWSQRWTPEVLAWRMRKPGVRYAIHASNEAVFISTVAHFHGIPVCVIVKTLPKRGVLVSQGNALAAAACRFHRAPGALYAGFSNRVRFTGVPLLDRLKPAPLNLIVKPSRPGFFDSDAFEFERFEFFDFDAF